MGRTVRRSYSTPFLITPGTDIPRGNDGVLIDCTVAGVVVLKMAGGTMPVHVNLGVSVLDSLEVIGVVVAGTTATATVFALR